MKRVAFESELSVYRHGYHARMTIAPIKSLQAQSFRPDESDHANRCSDVGSCLAYRLLKKLGPGMVHPPIT